MVETSEGPERGTTNLPVDISSFIGRRQQIVQVRSAVSDRRLVTLTGVGGVGKTRLALRVATSARRTFVEGGVWFVALGVVRDPALVPRAIADELHVHDQGSSPLVQLLVERLSDAATLIVLDNCEHVLDATAETVERLLGACPRLHVMATSRRALAIGGEAVLPVRPLQAMEARQLFLERAAAAAGFVSGPGDDAVVDRLCDRLDRLPLALELAAGRMTTFELREMVDLLEASEGLAPLGVRRGLPRQRTLRAAFDWSYDLLDESERSAWRRLARFESGFRLEGAQTLLGGDAQQLVGALVDHSIVTTEPRSGRTWYRMLETVRSYGRERLLAAGEGSEVERLLVRHYVAMAEEVERIQSGPGDDATWPAELDHEQGNLRLALELAGGAGGGDQLRLAASLVPYWDVRGHLEEGRRWLAAALSRPDADPATRAYALEGAGWLAFRQGDYPAARASSEQACEAAAAAGVQEVEVRARSNVGLVALLGGDPESARAQLEQSLRIARATGLRGVELGPLFVIALMAYLTGDLATAVARGEECLAVAREHGNLRNRALICALLATMRLELDETEVARHLLEEAIAIEGQIGERVNATFILGASARLAEAEGEHDRCVVLATAASQASRSSGSGLIDVWQTRVEAAAARASDALGSRGAQAARRRGADIDVTQALRLAGRGEPQPGARGAAPPGLSPRELEIAKLIGEGQSNRAMAERLHLSQRTVESHVEHILNKLGMRSRTEVAAWAVRYQDLAG